MFKLFRKHLLCHGKILIFNKNNNNKKRSCFSHLNAISSKNCTDWRRICNCPSSNSDNFQLKIYPSSSFSIYSQFIHSTKFNAWILSKFAHVIMQFHWSINWIKLSSSRHFIRWNIFHGCRTFRALENCTATAWVWCVVALHMMVRVHGRPMCVCALCMSRREWVFNF